MSRLLQVGLWAVCALCFLYAYDRLRRNLAYRRAALAKGCLEPRLYPHRDPVFGLDLFIAQMKNYKHHRLLEQSCRWVEQCGDTYQTNSLGVASIKTIEPENVQTIFAHNFEDYGLGPLRTDIAGDFMGRGIFTTDGKFWEHSRALVRPIFTKAQFADLNTLKVHVDRFISLIPRDGSTIDLLPLLHRLVSYLQFKLQYQYRKNHTQECRLSTLQQSSLWGHQSTHFYHRRPLNSSISKMHLITHSGESRCELY